jgi:hypothetical protein
MFGCVLALGCGGELPLWVSMSTDVVEGDDTSDDPSVLVYGAAPDDVPETTDTGFTTAASSTGTVRGVFLENRSSEDICYLHVHACKVGAEIQAACGQAAPGKSGITPEADVLGAQIFKPGSGGELWLEADCITVFAIDCEQARCWDAGEVDLTVGTQTVLFKG